MPPRLPRPPRGSPIRSGGCRSTPPYEALIEPGMADLDNAPSGGMAGSITAALFLRRFVTRLPALPAFRHLRLAAGGGAGPAQGRRRPGRAGAARGAAGAARHLRWTAASTPFSGRVAARRLQGQVAAEAFVDPEPVVARGNPFLLAAPGGAPRPADADRRRRGADRAARRLGLRRGGEGRLLRLGREAALAPAPAEPATHRVARAHHLGLRRPGRAPSRRCSICISAARLRLLADEGKWARIAVGRRRGLGARAPISRRPRAARPTR